MFFFLIGPILSLFAADFFWEDPEVFEINSFFPQLKSGGGIIASVWQEYKNLGEKKGFISLYCSVSENGVSWTKKVNVTGALPFNWEQKVSLFSLQVKPDGSIVVALAEKEKSISIFQSVDRGGSFSRISEISSENTIVAPKLFLKENGGLILFLTQKTEPLVEGTPGTLSIYYTESDNITEWGDLSQFVGNENLLQSFLPVYTSWNGSEYVIFQAILSSINFQLFFKKRDPVSDLWSDAKILTDFQDPYNPDIESVDFDNQRPFLIGIGDHLSLIWERKQYGLNSRIYYTQLNKDGEIISDVEAITDDFRISAFPRIHNKDGEEILLWFDNRDGNQIIMAQKRGLFWDEDVVSSISGDSIYGQFVPYRSKENVNLFLIAWENIYGNENRTVLLKPDQSVDSPVISSINYIKGRRSSIEFPLFSWTEPKDSSFIRGFNYIWTRDPEENPSRKLDPLKDPLMRKASFKAEEEGFWYLKVIAQDYAGNWSEPEILSYYYDTTPPDEVVFIETITDSFGFALSNSFELSWNPILDEDINRYYYKIAFMGSDILDSRYSKLTYSTPLRVANLDNKVSIGNFDNGYWGITVVAEDIAGNKSKPSIQIFRLNKYIPVTYISNVTSTTDDLLRVNLLIRGRGFSTEGKIQSVIIDKDGKLPWDYQFLGEDELYTVINDRTIEGPLIDDIEGGIYFIAVEHPRRGIVFAENQLKFEATGVVKFGDFSTDYKSIWNVIPYRIYSVSGNFILFISILILISLLISLSVFRLIKLGKEAQELAYDSKALFEGLLLTEELKKERLKTMKRKGIGLRIKFLFALLSLVLLVIMMVAISLGWYMINSQKQNLANSMRQRAELLLETIVSGAKNSLPLSGIDRSLGLSVLPKQISAMEDARFSTITGLGIKDIGKYNYIWASNDENINFKFRLPDEIQLSEIDSVLNSLNGDQLEIFESVYAGKDEKYFIKEDATSKKRMDLARILSEVGFTEPYSIGEKLIYDEISEELVVIEQTVNDSGKDIVGDLPDKIDDLKRRGIELALSGDTGSLALINDDIRDLSEQLDERLNSIANVTFVYPEFRPEELSRDQLEYIFYKPIVYQDTTAETYYRGTVRLGVSVELILDQIDAVIISLIKRTALISLAALLLGFFGASFLASTMINPIKKLVEGVERIRDTTDKTKLKGQKIIVKSKDELAELAETVNQMTEGLVKAAVANQQLILGKEVQKKFIPLDPVPSGDDRKLTTGRTENDMAEFFGYYEGAKGVSGDYFNYKQIDENHYACIKCDISGKDIPASLIMVEVATIFNSYCKNLNLIRDGIHLNKMVEDVNDQIEQLNFIGKFAAFTIVLINIKTGKTWLSNAGDNIVHYYDSLNRKMDTIELVKAPAAGPFSTDLVNMQGGFKQEIHTFQSGDILFLFTDGIEESQRYLRNSELEIVKCEGCDFSGVKGSSDNRDTDTHLEGSDVEELGLKRINEIAYAILSGGSYELIQHHDPFPEKPLTFDFSNCEDSIEDAVLGLLAVEKIFRMYPDPNAGSKDLLNIDRKVDDFLKIHFDQYSEYFRYPVENKSFPEYIYYSHLKETAQYDDLTILAIRKK